jgi:hypothetical protein
MKITISGCSSISPNKIANLMVKAFRDIGFGKVTKKLGSHKDGFDDGFDGFINEEWVSIVVDTKNVEIN